MAFGNLYRQARDLYNDRAAQQMQRKLPCPIMSREMDELKRIMDGLKRAFINAGGSKAD